MRAVQRDQLHRFARHLRVGRFNHHAVRDRHVWTDPEAKMIWLHVMCWKNSGWSPKPDQEFRACHRQALAGPDVKRDALPAPGIDFEPQSREGLHIRIRRHALLRSVAAKLPANDVVLTERRDRFQDLDLLIPDRLTVRPDGRLHGHVSQDLK